MPTLAVISGLSASTRPLSLLLGGADVILGYGTGANRYGTPLESIEVTEAGPGGVSSMTFIVEDPSKSLSVADGTEVQFWSNSGGPTGSGYLIFRGYVDASTTRPDGGVGRVFEVSCTGVEAWLDWIKVYPAVTIAVSTNTASAISALVQSTTAIIRACGVATGTSLRDGSFDQPVGRLNQTTDSTPEAFLSVGVTITGGSLREGIRQLVDASVNNDTTIPVTALVTLDWYLGLRVWPNRIDCMPDDWAGLQGASAIVNTAASALAAGALEVTVEWADIVHEVYVNGGTAAGSGWFSDGTGLRGRQEVIDAPLSTTAALAAQYAANYLAVQAAGVRGSFTLEDWVGNSSCHVGCLVDITDDQTGIATTYRIMEINKTFTGSFGAGRGQTWKVSFGGLQPSGARLIRHLTRGTTI